MGLSELAGACMGFLELAWACVNPERFIFKVHSLVCLITH